MFLDSVVRHLFPEHGARSAGTGLLEPYEASEIPDTSHAERMQAVKKISTLKAPGLDVIAGLAIKAAALTAPDFFRGTFNAYLQEGCFQIQCKVQRLVPIEEKQTPGGTILLPTTLLAGYHREAV